MNEEELLYHLSSAADDECHHKIDVVADVLTTIGQRTDREADERSMLFLAGSAIAVTAVITLLTMPSWVAIHSPWVSILYTLPGGGL